MKIESAKMITDSYRTKVSFQDITAHGHAIKKMMGGPLSAVNISKLQSSDRHASKLPFSMIQVRR